MVNFNTIISLALILGLIAALIWVVVPKYDAVSALMKEVSILQNDLSKKIEIKQKIDELEARYETYKGQLMKVSKILPAAKDYPGLLVTIQQLTSTAGLLMNDIDIKAEEAAAAKGIIKAGKTAAAEEEIFKKLAISLSVSGSYEQFKSFLGLLETNIRIIDVESVEFTYSDKELTKFNIRANTYYQP